MISLKVKKETFEKYLIDFQIHSSIKQYDDFIESIQRIVQKDLNEALKNDNLEKLVEKIFSNKENTNILMFSDKKEITRIRKDYLRNVLDDGKLDIYLEYKNTIFTEDVEKDAYLLRKTEKLSREKRSFIFDKYNWMTTKSKRFVKASAFLIEKQEFTLSLKDREDLNKEIIKNHKKHMSLNYSYALSQTVTNIRVIYQYDMYDFNKLSEFIIEKANINEEDYFNKDLEMIGKLTDSHFKIETKIDEFYEKWRGLHDPKKMLPRLLKVEINEDFFRKQSRLFHYIEHMSLKLNKALVLEYKDEIRKTFLAHTDNLKISVENYGVEFKMSEFIEYLSQ